MDPMTTEQRSRLMSRVKDRDTKVEVALRKAIWKEGFRYRKNFRVDGVRVDLAFTGYRFVVFIDGCFWHGCPSHYTIPGTRAEFWQAKIKANVERDRRQTIELEGRRWGILRVWEHEIETDPQGVAKKVCEYLRSGKRPYKKRDWRVVKGKHDMMTNESILTVEDLRDPTVEKAIVRNKRISSRK